MAAFCAFGPLRYPVWWVSEMTADPKKPAVYYQHVDGITRGMAVIWEFLEEGDVTRVRITHDWTGPRWPLIGRIAASAVIGPHFISAVARRTLAGVARAAEQRTRVSTHAEPLESRASSL